MRVCFRVGVRIITRTFRGEVFNGSGYGMRITYESPISAFNSMTLRLGRLAINCANEGDSACLFAISNRCLFVHLDDVAGQRVGLHVGILSARSHDALSLTSPITRRQLRRIERTANIASKGTFSVKTVPVYSIAVKGALSSTARSTGTTHAAGTSNLLLHSFLYFRFVDVLPVFSMLVVLFAFLEIARCLVNFVSFLGLVLYAEIIEVRIEVVLPNRLAGDLFSVVL